MPSETRYPALAPAPKQGDERFYSDAGQADFDLLSFWKWSVSDLVSNTTRGVLAEYLVARALGLSTGVRTEWDAYDLQMEDGTTIEVKAAAYLQAWHQKTLSQIRFTIAPTRGWDAQTGAWCDTSKRQADLYVFCLLKTKDQEQLDPMDLDQWTFYVLSTGVLNQHCAEQKGIELQALLRLSPVECGFVGLRDAVTQCSVSKSH